MRRAFSLSAALICVLAAMPAQAVTIEMKDAAPDRVERQRAFAEGAVPLPGTPDLTKLDERLASKGMKPGTPMFIRVFKAESELEIWMQKGDRFELFDTYPICHWSGTLGPKLREGDKQNPEGFYSIGARQLHRVGRWPRSLNLGFPNTLDRALKRSGSYMLVHGGCSSVGCFAMTNPVMDEIYSLTERALRAGQERIDIHVFPFRMTDENMELHAKNPWAEFWSELKPGYDAFESTRLPPKVGYCEQKYVVEPAAPGEVGEQRPLAACGGHPAAPVDPSSSSLADLPSTWPLLPMPTAAPRSKTTTMTMMRQRPEPRSARSAPQAPSLAALRRPAPVAPSCNPGLASCRRFTALRTKATTSRARVAGGVQRVR